MEGTRFACYFVSLVKVYTTIILKEPSTLLGSTKTLKLMNIFRAVGGHQFLTKTSLNSILTKIHPGTTDTTHKLSASLELTLVATLVTIV